MNTVTFIGFPPVNVPSLVVCKKSSQNPSPLNFLLCYYIRHISSACILKDNFNLAHISRAFSPCSTSPRAETLWQRSLGKTKLPRSWQPGDSKETALKRKEIYSTKVMPLWPTQTHQEVVLYQFPKYVLRQSSCHNHTSPLHPPLVSLRFKHTSLKHT